jgi:hypothetical protein
MRNRAGKKYFGLGTDWFSVVPVLTVGKPYKLPGWSTVGGYVLALKKTLCDLERFSDSAPECLILFNVNRRVQYKSAPRGREVGHF